MEYSQPAKIGNKTIQLCPLSSKEERAEGYQHAEHEPSEDEGLLFIFDDEKPRHFHMRNVPFDLDLLGFNSDGRLVWVVPMTANNKHNYKTLPCKYAVEVPSGWGYDLLIGASKIILF
jgi:uncharacterized membrane protein (UPF0127 family)